MNEVEHPIKEPELIPNNLSFIARIPERIYSQIREGYSIKIYKNDRNDRCIELINENGELVGDFQPDGTNPSGPFDSIMKVDKESCTPVLKIPPDYSFKTNQSKLIEIKEHAKKHETMSQNQQIIKNLRNEGTDIFRDWSAKKAYNSLLVMKQRFEKSKRSIYSLLDEFQTAINTNPQILSDPSILQSVTADVNSFLSDMKSVTQCVDNFGKANQNKA